MIKITHFFIDNQRDKMTMNQETYKHAEFWFSFFIQSRNQVFEHLT